MMTHMRTELLEIAIFVPCNIIARSTDLTHTHTTHTHTTHVHIYTTHTHKSSGKADIIS